MSKKLLPHDHGQAMEQELEHMPSVDNFQTVADIFKQLGDGSRIRIFWLLCHCEECVINLSSMVDMSSPAVSHHLRQLKAGGLIVSRREGKEVYYKAADTARAQLLHHMIEHLVEIPGPGEWANPRPAPPPGNVVLKNRRGGSDPLPPFAVAYSQNVRAEDQIIPHPIRWQVRRRKARTPPPPDRQIPLRRSPHPWSRGPADTGRSHPAPCGSRSGSPRSGGRPGPRCP